MGLCEAGHSWSRWHFGWDTERLFEMFTEQAREAIVRAQDEAREMGHGTVQMSISGRSWEVRECWQSSVALCARGVDGCAA